MRNSTFIFQHITSTSSTMDVARQRLQEHPNTYLVISDEQIKGRGQRGRTWHSLKGNLFMTLILPIGREVSTSKLSLAAGLAVRESIMGIIPPSKIKCKWPNDVLINNSKVAGVLIETEEEHGEKYAIIGIGMNITSYPELSTAIKATSLKEHTDQEISSIEIGKSIAHNIIKIMNNPQLDIREYWLSNAYGLNRTVKFQHSYTSAYMEGRFIGLSDDGGCIINGPNGLEIIYTSSLIFPENALD